MSTSNISGLPSDQSSASGSRRLTAPRHLIPVYAYNELQTAPFCIHKETINLHSVDPYEVNNEELPLIYHSREEWMRLAGNLARTVMAGAVGYSDIPEPFYGVPIHDRTKVDAKWKGRCSFASSADMRIASKRSCHIEVSDRLVCPADVLDVVFHEIAHAVVMFTDGRPDNHTGNFIHLCRAAGLQPLSSRHWTTTTFSPAVYPWVCERLFKDLGRWSHEWVGPIPQPIKRTVQIKVSCRHCKSDGTSASRARYVTCSIPEYNGYIANVQNQGSVPEGFIPDYCGGCGEVLVVDDGSVVNHFMARNLQEKWMPSLDADDVVEVK